MPSLIKHQRQPVQLRTYLAMIVAAVFVTVLFIAQARMWTVNASAPGDGRISPTATFTVNSTDDPGDGVCDAIECTLREAILAANAAPGPDTITITATGNFNLFEALPTITDGVSINGVDPSQQKVQRISTIFSFRIFNIASAADVTLSSITIGNGRAPLGAGVLNDGLGTVTLNNCILQQNTATTTGGGGLYNNGGMVIVSNSIIFNNSAPAGNGGGIFNQSGTVTVTNSTLAQNEAAGEGGGGIFNNDPGNVTVNDSVLRENTAAKVGGGIYNKGSVTIMNSTLTRNAVVGFNISFNDGVALENQKTAIINNSTFSANEGNGIGSETGSLTLTNSTVSGNSGAGVVNESGTAAIANSTLTRNSLGVFVSNLGGTTNLKSSIVAENLNDVRGSINSQGHNVVGSTSSATITPTTGDKFNADAFPLLIDSLKNNGGPTETHMLGCKSVAVNNGVPNGLATDQRGTPRTQGGGTDSGAYELGPCFNVNDLAGTNDFSCDPLGTGTGDENCTLPEGIDAANAANPALGIPAVVITLPGTINLINPLPNITKGMTIIVFVDLGTNQSPAAKAAAGNHATGAATTGAANGPAPQVTVRRNTGGDYQVFVVNTPGVVTLAGLTIRNGNSGFAGGVFKQNNAGTVTIRDCVVSGNTGTMGGGIYNSGAGTISIVNSTVTANTGINFGGGIFNAGAGTVNITDSTVSNNSGGNFGGGLLNQLDGTINVTRSTINGNSSKFGGGGLINNSTGTVNINNSTVSGNMLTQAGATGGGIVNFSGTVNINNSTITANTANLASSSGGGISNSTGTVNLRSSIVALNTAPTGPDLAGTFTSQGNNVVGSTSGATITATTGDKFNAAASPLNIGPLQDNGGSTFTHALLAGSVAIDNGINASSLLSDQRGFARTNDDPGIANAGDGTDTGAFEGLFVTSSAGCPTNFTADQAMLTLCLTQGGTTTFSPITPASGGTVPAGYTLCDTCPAYEITTNATFTPPVTVCLAVPVDVDDQTYSMMKLLHGEGGALVDRTTGHFTDNNGQRWVCGNVDSLSPFALAAGLTPTATDGVVSGIITDSTANPLEGAEVRMSGTQNRLTVTDAEGKYRFDDVETNGFYTVTPSRVNFMFSPSRRSFSQLGQHTEAAFAASLIGGASPLDSTAYFVRQHYLDFLGREPDEAGFNFWYNNIESCGADADCRARRREATSAAFFLSIEFQETGYWVYRMYQSAYGDIPGAPVPVKLSEFKPDTEAIGQGVIVNQSGWEAALANNTKAFAEAFVQRARFTFSYPLTMSPAEFVDRLLLNAAVVPSGTVRTAMIDEFGAARNTADVVARARALRLAAEHSGLREREFNPAFVLMQYFGYLRRNPDEAPEQNLNFDGHNFWLTKLNHFNGNFGDAEMVKSFLVSGEYRGRFLR